MTEGQDNAVQYQIVAQQPEVKQQPIVVYVDQHGNPMTSPPQQQLIYVVNQPSAALNIESNPTTQEEEEETGIMQYCCNCSKRTKIIIALIIILFILVGTFIIIYFFVINPPTPEPTPSPTSRPTESPTISRDGSATCFSSDSYVLTFPYFEKKQIEDLNIYDKILIYDELQNTFVWDELLFKFHFDEDEYLNNILVPMINFTLNNGQSLSMTFNHLLYVESCTETDIGSGLQRADKVKIGDKLKYFNGSYNISYVIVTGINKNVMKYPRNMLTYNGNLVINGVAISFFSDTLWGESEYWGQIIRYIMKYAYSYNIWRTPFYYFAKLWTQYTPMYLKQVVLKFYFTDYTNFGVFCFGLVTSLII
eukprot:418909_1